MSENGWMNEKLCERYIEKIVGGGPLSPTLLLVWDVF
jgi:hypothetical protein